MTAKEELNYLNEDELAAFIYEDHDLNDMFETVVEETMVDSSRWMISYEKVFRYIDGTFWKFFWDRGATEYQDVGPENVQYLEVVPQEIIKVVYVPKK